MALALIVAAGSGERLGADRPKALVELAGRPLVQWSIEVLAQVPAIERLVVALPPASQAPAPAAASARAEESARERATGRPLVMPLPAGVSAPPGTLAVAGGSTRSESVALALAAAGAGDPVLVHDAARPLLTAALAEALLAAGTREGLDGAVAAAPVTDTIKRAGADGVVLETLERASLWAVQTPQVFRRAALERALAVPAEVLARATDDAWLVERGGGTLVVVPAARENLKVTTAIDLVLAEALLRRAGRAGPAGAPAPGGG